MRDTVWISIITMLILLPRIISETLFRFSNIKYVWVFRIIDILDLTLQTISFIVLVYYLYKRFFWDKDPNMVFVFVLLAMFLMGGHLMHSAANAVDMSYRETVGIPTETAMPKETYTLLHFIDEYLSHIILYTALYLLFGLAAKISLQEVYTEPKQIDRIIPTFMGFMLGGGLGISCVEASIPLYMLALSLIIMAFLIEPIIRKEHSLRDGLDRPYLLFTITLLLMTIISIAVYLAVFGFTSPRELIGEYLANLSARK